jgi:hypothetical protein
MKPANSRDVVIASSPVALPKASVRCRRGHRGLRHDSSVVPGTLYIVGCPGAFYSPDLRLEDAGPPMTRGAPIPEDRSGHRDCAP